jgi:NADH dehydrogenase subunit D (EC 1.6.5.3)
MVLNMGPHHPSMHGVLRLIVTLDGEDVVDCEPVLGYLHRGMEKIAENRTNVMYVPYVSRWDYAEGMFNEAVTVNAPEKLANIAVPKRASYIRVIMLELNRIANHLLWLGPFLADVGAQTPFFYTMRDREMILDLWEAATGYRMVNNNYFRIGGVAADLPYGWVDKCEDYCDYFIPKIDEYERLITNNPIFRRRIEGWVLFLAKKRLTGDCPAPCCALPALSGICGKLTITNVTTTSTGKFVPKLLAIVWPGMWCGFGRCASRLRFSIKP